MNGGLAGSEIYDLDEICHLKLRNWTWSQWHPSPERYDASNAQRVEVGRRDGCNGAWRLLMHQLGTVVYRRTRDDGLWFNHEREKFEGFEVDCREKRDRFSSVRRAKLYSRQSNDSLYGFYGSISPGFIWEIESVWNKNNLKTGFSCLLRTSASHISEWCHHSVLKLVFLSQLNLSLFVVLIQFNFKIWIYCYLLR